MKEIVLAIISQIPLIASSVIAILAIIVSFIQNKRHDKIEVISKAELLKYERIKSSIVLFMSHMEKDEHNETIDEYYKIKLELDLAKEYNLIINQKLDFIFSIIKLSILSNTFISNALKMDVELTPDFKSTLNTFRKVFESKESFEKNKDLITTEFDKFNGLLNFYQMFNAESKKRIDMYSKVVFEFNENFDKNVEQINASLCSYKSKSYKYINHPFDKREGEEIEYYFKKQIKENISLSFIEYLNIIWNDIKRKL